MNSMNRPHKALTLPEAMITVALLAVVFTIVVSIYTSSSAFVTTNNQVIDLQSRSRHALEWLAKDIRESNTYIPPQTINSAGVGITLTTINGSIDYKFSASDIGYKLIRNNIVIADHINRVEIRSNGHGYHLELDVLSIGRLNSVAQLGLKQVVRSRNE